MHMTEEHGGGPGEPTALSDAEFASAYESLVEAARVDFLAYLHLFNPQGASEFILSGMHRYLADLVQGVADGDEDPCQAVSCPPQHGKSTMLSKEAASWVAGRFPGTNIGITGHSYDLVNTFSKWIKSRVTSPLYQRVFPQSMPVRGSDRSDMWDMENGTGVVAKPAGSKFIGRRVDWLICDDVHPGRAEAESATMRRRVIEWYFNDCATRLHPASKVFLIGTRWHPDDLIGHLTSPDYVEQLAIEEEGIRAEDPGYHTRQFNVTKFAALATGGADPLGREAGEPLFPEERPKSFLLGIKASTPAYDWDSLYQQEPRSASSGHADLSKIKYISVDEIPWGSLELVRGWDLAITDKQTSDFTAGLLLGHNPATGDLYLLDIARGRLAWAKMRTLVITTSLADRAHRGGKGKRPPVLRVGIEGVAGFDAVFQDVRRELLGEVKVEKKNPPSRGGKLLRAQPWLNRLESGDVHILRAPWTKDFVDELDNFPEGKHDDMVDAMSIAFEMIEAKPKQLLIA